ncbi:hypothetical protein BT93_B2492 [Corymbia citriodora subsp. variegata]|nr:hypothetical protein BT93_B2492 [Corymbia citriodora subsp. variegata]KAF8040266.1 hypothetical protein BT93_B2492 [Corymbia citriodora subsp. variegata]
MAAHNLAVILRSSSGDPRFLLARQRRPPEFGDEEYDSYVDSDLWDLPSAPLSPLAGPRPGEVRVRVEDAAAAPCSEKVDLGRFDVDSAVVQGLGLVGLEVSDVGEWRFFKYVEEAEFGPGLPVNTVFIEGKLIAGDCNLPESCKWMSIRSCLDWLVDVKPSSDRVGLLAVLGLINDSMPPSKFKVPSTLIYQEYPSGVVVVPMGSRTAKPFRTTNLVVFAPSSSSDECGEGNFIMSGDALIVDPGCQSQHHEELGKIVAALPRKLIVFLTHHHHDHIEGLSVIQKCNSDAILLAHENTISRIQKDVWSLGSTPVSGAEDICIGGQRLTIIFAPGHTDGHLALLHSSTHSLIVGDHCVGQGSSVLDMKSGGNVIDYFQSTYKFMELSPHALIPMHGRVNLWPKHMLCGYLKNRRKREESILKAIEGGAQTLFDIVSNVYSEVDRSFWLIASWNVRLHVDHLAQQDKLPKDFSMDTFHHSFVAFPDNLDKNGAK